MNALDAKGWGISPVVLEIVRAFAGGTRYPASAYIAAQRAFERAIGAGNIAERVEKVERERTEAWASNAEWKRRDEITARDKRIAELEAQLADLFLCQRPALESEGGNG